MTEMSNIRKEGPYQKIYYFLAAVFILFGIGLGIYYFKDDKPALFMGLGTILYFLIPLILKKMEIILPYRLLVFFIIYLILGYNVGFIMDGYSRFMHFDKFVHFISGFLNVMAGLIVFLYINRTNKAVWSSSILFSLFFSMFIALTCEFIECAVFLTTGYDAQRTLTTGVFDTMGDLTACLISSIVISIYYYHKGKRNEFEKTIVGEFCRLNRCQ